MLNEQQIFQQFIEGLLQPAIERGVERALRKHSDSLTTQQESLETILSAEQAAKFIGVSLATLYGLTSARKIPHSKRGKRLYFDRESILLWVREGKRKSISEIEDEAAGYISTARYGKHTQPTQVKKH